MKGPDGQLMQPFDVDNIHLFHNRCVRLARFENDRTISFIPPDGAFDLMTYRLSTQVMLKGKLQFILPKALLQCRGVSIHLKDKSLFIYTGNLSFKGF